MEIHSNWISIYKMKRREASGCETEGYNWVDENSIYFSIDWLLHWCMTEMKSGRGDSKRINSKIVDNKAHCPWSSTEMKWVTNKILCK